MKDSFKQYWSATYSQTEWTFMKCSIALVWMVCIIYVLLFQKAVSYPVSFCEFVDCSVLNLLAIKIGIAVLAITAIVFYVQEKQMLLSLGTIAVISVFVFTVSDSMGFYDRYDMLSCIFIAQFIAYLFFSKNNLSQRRVQFSVQVVAAAYTTSGISKLLTSGFNWALKSEHFALQVRKGYTYAFADYGRLSALQMAERLSQVFIAHPFLVECVLLFSLLLELFAIVMIFDKRITIVWGTLLLLMHLGILLFMNVFLFAVVPAAIIVLVNPVYLVYIWVRKNE